MQEHLVRKLQILVKQLMMGRISQHFKQQAQSKNKKELPDQHHNK
jgi:hypothetical protein